VPEVGFRPASGGLALTRPVEVTKDPEHALKVMHLVSTSARGTELAFEMRDEPRLVAAKAGNTDYMWHRRMRVELRDARGTSVPRANVRGENFSIGQHEFGFLRQDILFDQLPAETRRLTLEIRGDLGEWDVPLEVAPIGEVSGVPAATSNASVERNGIVVRVRTIARTGGATCLEVEAAALSPSGEVLGVGAWMRRGEETAFTVVDDRGRRYEEVFTGAIARRSQHGGRSVASFARLPDEVDRATLVVPAVVMQEADAGLDIPLPIYVPTDLSFGPHPITIRWADIVPDLRVAPGHPATRGVEVQFKSDTWQNDRRVLRPGKLLLDGERTWNFGFDHELRLSIMLREEQSPKTVTFLEPVVEVRGPWEIEFSLR
jgi:hypothetical protein